VEAAVLRSKLDALGLVLALSCAGCSAEQDKQATPHQLPVFDGQARSHLITADALRIDPGPDANELFERVMSCYPAQSLFRAELHAEARTGRVGGGADGSGQPGPGAGIVLRVPLWSSMDLERERERESQRRQKVASSVGVFVGALVEWRLAGRELELLRGIEKRAQLRVQAGVAETSEQLQALERVAALERERVQHLAKITQARLEMVGLCSGDLAGPVAAYLGRFATIEAMR
jgi:hypothetical protein